MENSHLLWIVQIVAMRCALGLLGLATFIVFTRTRSVHSGVFTSAILFVIAGFLTHHLATPRISFEEFREGVEFSFIEPWESISRLSYTVAAILVSIGSLLLIAIAFRRPAPSMESR